MNENVCNDNRFNLIAKYKAKLIEATNIETSQDEMAVIDNILFRMWQMGWLDKLDAASPWRRVEDELPDEVGSYLVYAPTYIGGSSSAKECKAGVMFAKWLKGGHWSIEVGYYKRPGCVTHWMPIEPPKEDA